MEKIKGIRKHIGVLERRATYLTERIDGDRLSDAARAFEDREREAINMGIQALQVAHMAQDAGTSPVLALEELLDAIEQMEDDGHDAEWTDRVRQGVAHGRAVLSMMDAAGG